MLLNFIGCPSSGKTTTAAMVFTTLKECGFTTEFIAEEARRYIAAKKANDSGFKLVDDDQEEILRRQITVEQDFARTQDSKSFIVCDSSAFNALLYLSPERRIHSLQTVADHGKSVNYFFYCKPTAASINTDKLRLHTWSQSQALDEKLLSIWTETFGDRQFITLDGTPNQRLQNVLQIIMQRLPS